ncbi:MAG TPA: prepilin peptidase [Thermoanaerobaculia bacterium]|nr:prepilin peptidase [Thermoanaerobaculia bacterium]
MQLQILLAVYVTLLGLIVGSYLNVVIHRVPLGLSTVRPRSRCPVCGTMIGARDNVPVLSWVFLRGRCRSCGTPISWRYPLIEAAAGGLFLACLLRFGFTLHALTAAVFAALMLALAMIDYDHMLLPDRITWPGIAVGLAAQLWGPLVGLGSALVGVALGAGILLAVWCLWWLVRREEGMGLGDVKMLALVGAFLGWTGVLVTLFFATLTGSIVGISLMRAGGPEGGMTMRSKLPFGVFLAIAGVIALFFGDALVWWYAGLL